MSDEPSKRGGLLVHTTNDQLQQLKDAMLLRRSVIIKGLLLKRGRARLQVSCRGGWIMGRKVRMATCSTSTRAGDGARAAEVRRLTRRG